MEFRTDKQTAITLIIHKAISLEDGFYVITFRVTATAKNYVRSNVWANTETLCWTKRVDDNYNICGNVTNHKFIDSYWACYKFSTRSYTNSALYIYTTI